jgi:glycosyltransferase involved in cell wall biosynthesis
MKISCIIPTYNRYEYLKRAINSVYNGNKIPNEIIIIDDGSTDNTSNITKDYQNIIYHFIKNKGVSTARNVGIKKAKYEWICFLDSDDVWEKDKLKNQINFHKKNKDILISQSNEKWIRNDIQVNIPKKYKKYKGYIFKEAINETIVSMSSLMINKKILEDVGYFDEMLKVCEDYDLTLKIARKYKFGLIETKDITKYGGHKNQLSKKYPIMDIYRIQALKKHLDNHSNLEYIQNAIIKKANIICKGAKKRNNIDLYNEYKKLILSLSPLYN